jgi:DNA integrity scanning protein DisA with diadenylate cyclase activity
VSASRGGRGEALRASLWFWPAVVAAASLVVTMLQVVATSIMTAMTLTFSLTVVALQPASRQFSPRLLREFARDTKTQVVPATLISAFVISLTGLRGMRLWGCAGSPTSR